MNPHYNLPPEQRAAQRLVDQFNADEALWRKLEPLRRLRRKAHPPLSRTKLKRLAMLSNRKLMAPPKKRRREIGFHAVK